MGTVSGIGRRVLSYLPAVRVIRRLGNFRMRLDSSQHIDARLLYTGRYEPNTVAAIKRLVRPGDVAVDVGANIGYITLTMASIVGPSGRVYAFEPSGWTFGRLSENVDLNPSASWITPVRAAVGDEDRAEVELTLPCGYRLDWKDTAKRQTVPMVRLDAYLASEQRIDLIKTDTDGHEPAVLSGAAGIIERFRPHMVIEVAPDATSHAGQDLRAMFSRLSGLGYKYETDDGSAVDDPMVLASRLPRNGSYNVLAISSAPPSAPHNPR